MVGATVDRRTVIKSGAAAASAGLLPRSAFSATAPRKGGSLRVSMPYNPASVDPMTGRNLPDFNVLYAVFDALIDFEPSTLALKPGLAKSWSFGDPTTLVLDLVDGVGFHDGAPFNAEAVKFNLERYKTDPRSNVKPDLGTLDKVEVTGASQVTLRLNKPNAGLPTVLTNRVGCMVSPKSVQDKGPNVDRTPVGTGPFRSCATTSTGSRACPISTASTFASSTSSTPRCAPRSPARPMSSSTCRRNKRRWPIDRPT